MVANKNKASKLLVEQLARVWQVQCAKEELTTLLLPKQPRVMPKPGTKITIEHHGEFQWMPLPFPLPGP